MALLTKDVPPPEKIGPYGVGEEIGAGGMGKVYRGFDQRLDRPVALKHIRADTSSTSARERFRREARSVARLNHPSIVQVYDWVETSEGDWLIMELVDGQSLKRLLMRGPLPPWRTKKIARQILSGLAIAHAAGIVHRDLKPDNIMLTAGDQVKILDFGLAKHVGNNDNEPALTIEGRLIGTVSAMSPEQAVGESVDHRSDLFSLGTLLYESLTGVSPFHSDNKVQTLTRICTLQQRPVKDLRPEVLPAFSDIIDHLMEKDPEDRPHSALEVMSALDSMEEGSASSVDIKSAPTGSPALSPFGAAPSYGQGGFATKQQDSSDGYSSDDGSLPAVDPRRRASAASHSGVGARSITNSGVGASGAGNSGALGLGGSGSATVEQPVQSDGDAWVTESADSPVENWNQIPGVGTGAPSITTIEPSPMARLDNDQGFGASPSAEVWHTHTEVVDPVDLDPSGQNLPTRAQPPRVPFGNPPKANVKDLADNPSDASITITKSSITETNEGPSLKVVFRLDGGSEKIMELDHRRKSVLDLARDNDLEIYSECGGRARCSTCRIRILDGLGNVMPRKPREAKLAERLGWEDEIRLACQTRLVGDITVERLVRDSQDIGLLLDEHSQTLPAQEATLAILSCELLDFDNFATKAPPYDQIHLLHRFLTQMGSLVSAHSGRIQNYTGTGFRAFFGLDGGSADEKCLAAVRAALRIAERMRGFNRYASTYFTTELQLGIGLHFGRMVVGQFGSPSKRHLLGIGEAAGLADAVSAHNSTVQTTILATEELINIVEDELDIGDIFPEEPLAGRSASLYEIYDLENPDPVFLVQTSFERLSSYGEEGPRVFYETIFEMEPATRAMFADTNMEAQGQKFVTFLSMVVNGIDRLDAMRSQLREMGERHVHYGVERSHYGIVGQALLTTVEKVTGVELTLETRQAWSEFYTRMVNIMLGDA